MQVVEDVDVLDEGVDEKIEAAFTCIDVSDAINELVVIANESIGCNNSEQVTRALSAGLNALLKSHNLTALNKVHDTTAMEAQMHSLNQLHVAMEQIQSNLAVANEAFFEDALKWFNTIGENNHNKMTALAIEANALLEELDNLSSSKASVSTFHCSQAVNISVAGMTKPSDILRGYTNTLNLIKLINKEYPGLFRALCSEVIDLYKTTSSITTGAYTTLGMINFVGFCVAVGIAIVLGVLGNIGLLLGTAVSVGVGYTAGDFVDGIFRWALEKFPNERRQTMKQAIETMRKNMERSIESYLRDFSKSGVNGNVVFALSLKNKKPLLVLQKQERSRVNYDVKIPSISEMKSILKAIVDSADDYITSSASTDLVTRIIDETEKDFSVAGKKHHLTTDALSYDKQAVRQASTSLYYKTEGLYRKPIAELGAHQVRSAKAILTYVREAMRFYE